MSAHLNRSLTTLRRDLLAMGGIVEGAVRDAAQALIERRPEQARRVIAADREVDRRELAIDEECLRILALHQPVAGDLRFIAAVMKINNDLERIGDLAKGIAERALDIHGRPGIDAPLQFELMTETVSGMLRDSLDALVRRDPIAARDVVRRDDVVDGINRDQIEALETAMQARPGSVPTGTLLLSASRNFERIADLATNIAEGVVFLVDAVDIRHAPPSS